MGNAVNSSCMRGLISGFYLESADLTGSVPLAASRIIEKEYGGNSWVKVLPDTGMMLVTGEIIFGFSSELLSPG
jgi:hypothetical protein